MPTADELLGVDVAKRLISTMERAAPDSALQRVRQAAGALDGLSLRERSDLLKDALLDDLPGDYESLERTFRAGLADDEFTGWLIWPVTEAVTAKALADGGTAAFDAALALLADLTPRLTGEFAIRPLLEADLGRALAIVQNWTAHEDEHVRRFASEGTRPQLPWAKKVKAILAAPESTVPILDALYRDESEYVRRSVANHLNDLSRHHPDLAAAVATRWMDKPDAGTAKLVRHAMRTLIKKAHPAALALLGFVPAGQVRVTGPALAAKTVMVGEELAFEVTVFNAGAEPAVLAIDYLVHHLKANGSQTPKVFKLAVKTLAAGESVTFSRRHSFKLISTRVYYPGVHGIEVQVNGVLSGRTDFRLVDSA